MEFRKHKAGLQSDGYDWVLSFLRISLQYQARSSQYPSLPYGLRIFYNGNYVTTVKF